MRDDLCWLRFAVQYAILGEASPVQFMKINVYFGLPLCAATKPTAISLMKEKRAQDRSISTDLRSSSEDASPTRASQSTDRTKVPPGSVQSLISDASSVPQAHSIQSCPAHAKSNAIHPSLEMRDVLFTPPKFGPLLHSRRLVCLYPFNPLVSLKAPPHRPSRWPPSRPR